MRGRFRAGDSSWSIGFLMAATVGLGGCGSDAFVPPPPEGLREALSANAPQTVKKAETGAKPVEVILAPRDENAATTNGHYALTQGGYDSVLVHPETPTEKTTPAGQADLVEAAIKTKPPVLIVEPSEKPDPRLSKLVDQARDQGIPVVLVGSALNKVDGAEIPKDAVKPTTTSSSGGKAPLVRVDTVPFAASAKQLVQSAMRVAKNARVDPKGGAILYYPPNGDPYTEARVGAIRAALTEAGIKDQFVVHFNPEPNAADTALKAEIAKQSKVTMIFPFEYRTFMSTLTVTTALQETRTLVVAGYNSEEKSPFLHQIPNMAAVAEFRPARLIRQAVRSAGALIRGETISTTIEVPIEFTDSAPNTGLPELRPKKQDKTAEDLLQE